LRLLHLLLLVEAPRQLQVFSCARGLLLASATARAALRSHGASAVAAAVTIMMGQPPPGAAAAAAAAILPFMCSDHIDDPVNLTAIPSLFSSASIILKSVSTCADFTPWTASILESVLDLLYSCRYCQSAP
jgi:hypothetical protein